MSLLEHARSSVKKYFDQQYFAVKYFTNKYFAEKYFAEKNLLLCWHARATMSLLEHARVLSTNSQMYFPCMMALIVFSFKHVLSETLKFLEKC